MDRLRRLRWEIPTTLPFYSNNRRMGVPGGLEQHQVDGSNVWMGATGGWEIPTAAGLPGAAVVGEYGARRPATTSPSTQQCCCYYIESIPRRVLR